MHKLDNKVFMYSTGDSNQHSIIHIWGNNLEKNEYMYNWITLLYTYENNTIKINYTPIKLFKKWTIKNKMHTWKFWKKNIVKILMVLLSWNWGYFYFLACFCVLLNIFIITLYYKNREKIIKHMKWWRKV